MECYAGSRNPGVLFPYFIHMARLHISLVNFQVAVRSKISRERVGVEIDKMLKGTLCEGGSVTLLSSTTARNPLLSLEMIDSLSLYDSVFWLPSAMMGALSGQPARRSRGLVAAGILDSLLSSADMTDSTATRALPRYALPQAHSALFPHAADSNVRRRLLLAAALTPFRGITLPDKKRAVPAAEAVIREGLKVRTFAVLKTLTLNILLPQLGTQNHYMDGIPALFEASARLSRPALDRFKPSSVEQGATTLRSAIGLVLKDKSAHNPNTGSHWSSSLLFSLVQDLVSAWNEVSGEIEGAR